MAFRRFTDIEVEQLKDYMYILDTLVCVKGAMYLQHLGKIALKSYEQVTRDIKYLEEIGLVEKRYITTEDNKTLKSTIVFLTRKAYNRLLGIDRKNVKGSEVLLQKALMEGYLFLHYKEQYKTNKKIINNIIEEHLYKDTNNIWIDNNKHYFDILKDKNIIFTNYFIKKNIHYYDVSIVFKEQINPKKIIQIIEDLYLLFINCTIVDFKFKISVISRKKITDYKKILNKIRKHKPDKRLYKKFRNIYEKEFRNSIDFYYLNLENRKYVLRKFTTTKNSTILNKNIKRTVEQPEI